MQAIIDAIFGATGSAHLQFLVFVFLGVSVGWILARPSGWSCWRTTLLVVGVSGAWLGGEFACLIGQAPRGGPGQVLSAMAGAAALAYAWRWLHPRPDIAADPPRA